MLHKKRVFDKEAKNAKVRGFLDELNVSPAPEKASHHGPSKTALLTGHQALSLEG
jgi:hypothetical protein